MARCLNLLTDFILTANNTAIINTPVNPILRNNLGPPPSLFSLQFRNFCLELLYLARLEAPTVFVGHLRRATTVQDVNKCPQCERTKRTGKNGRSNSASHRTKQCPSTGKGFNNHRNKLNLIQKQRWSELLKIKLLAANIKKNIDTK
jgi:hypothetical protein